MVSGDDLCKGTEWGVNNANRLALSDIVGDITMPCPTHRSHHTFSISHISFIGYLSAEFVRNLSISKSGPEIDLRGWTQYNE